jgi:hypothetical protein
MRRKTSTWVVALLVIGVVWMANPRVGESFNDEAHKILSTRAVNPGLPNASMLDSFLKSVLGFEFPQGISQSLHGGQDGTVVGQIQIGSVNEDKGKRPRNHFHDPTKAWETAGLFQGTPVFGGQSSVVWSQNSTQSEGKHSWKDARDAYFNALTSTTSQLRKSWYAELFQSLGHLIHLVQDAAVPSHTRNDSHLVVPDNVSVFGGLKLDPDPFHYWADSPVGLNRINRVAEAQRFDSSILDQGSPNPLAPVPIARIIDKTDGDIGILSPNVNIGLAEYSNANFISKGTARSTSYQYPIYSQLQFGTVETLPNGKRVRYARFRPGFGEQDYRVGVSSRMVQFVNASVPPDSIDFGLDDNVHEDYGRKLFPRAIGYSAGLIDYFFRGYINHGFYRTEVPASSPPTTLREQLWGLDPPEEQTGLGTVAVLLVYWGQDNTSETFPRFVVSSPVTANVTPTPGDVTFSFSSLPFPATLWGEVFYDAFLIYRGQLGYEDGAVIVSPCSGADVAFSRFPTPEGEIHLYAGPIEGCYAYPQ